eukprot:jgi/Botrbrau1/3234/Bobra.174_1s0007.1
MGCNTPSKLSSRRLVDKRAVVWERQKVDRSHKRLEFVPGRDELLSAADLASGLDARDRETGQHVLWCTQLPDGVLVTTERLVIRILNDWGECRLKPGNEGRKSAGLVDVAAVLREPENKRKFEEALKQRKTRLLEQDPNHQERPEVAKQRIVHVSRDMRKVYIGHFDDKKYEIGKSWRSGPIRSWSGGIKRPEKVGKSPVSDQCKGKLSKMYPEEEKEFIEAVNLLWDQFRYHPETREAAERMLREVVPTHKLGRSAWNAYNVNIDYATGPHFDLKNTPGSYSALFICETGPSFNGCFYCLPAFSKALDLRQGLVLYHRAGHPKFGLHGNSELDLNNHPDSHRIAVVLYQTRVGPRTSKRPGLSVRPPLCQPSNVVEAPMQSLSPHPSALTAFHSPAQADLILKLCSSEEDEEDDANRASDKPISPGQALGHSMQPKANKLPQMGSAPKKQKCLPDGELGYAHRQMKDVPETASEIADSTPKVWEVEAILDRKAIPHNGKFRYRYLVEWEGPYEPSWEPRTNLTRSNGCRKLVDEFDIQYDKKCPEECDVNNNCMEAQCIEQPQTKSNRFLSACQLFSFYL